MSETLHYHTVDELRALGLDELRALWELVPTDRQRMYRAAYEREVRTAGAEGSDAKERQVAAALLARYETAALVPVGMRWARAPGRVQEAARSGASLEAELDSGTRQSGKPSGKIIAVMGVLMLAMIALLFSRGTGGGEAEATTEVDMPVIGVSTITPTPLALEAQDDVIAGGDADRAPFYPINLQVSAPDSAVPRVWVVQRRAVRASEWNYDENPDTASFLNGMSVRPIIGIPWSEENAAWFEQIGDGAAFSLQMNTGAILRYEFEGKREVRRSETDIFRQVNPGLVLLLLGERDADGLPTATRTLVTALYSPIQELSRTGELIGTLALPSVVPMPTVIPTQAPTPLPFAGLDVQVIRVTTREGQLTTRLRLYNGGASPMLIESDDIWLALGYVENPSGPRIPAEGLTPFNLLPGQAADVTINWVWSGEPYSRLSVGDHQFALMLTS